MRWETRRGDLRFEVCRLVAAVKSSSLRAPARSTSRTGADDGGTFRATDRVFSSSLLRHATFYIMLQSNSRCQRILSSHLTEVTA